MELIWTKNGSFHRVGYESEADLESAILQVQDELFGPHRIYLDIKRRVGGRGGPKNIPDGYLLDLSGKKPRLYVVENELAAHDPLRHIAVQILQFSLSFEAEPRAVKGIVYQAIRSQSGVESRCKKYASAHGFRNLDHLLESLVYEAPFAALVIIDELPDNLENILAKKFQFGVEVLVLARYENDKKERIYNFEPFLADVVVDAKKTKGGVEEVDTIVVPAREDGFQETFIGENRWYEIRIHSSMRPQIKFIAAYRVDPVSAITHVAPVKSIVPWKDTNKFVVNFSEAAVEIGRIALVKGGRVKALQNIRYTTREKLMAAKTLDNLW